jgi:hypothetical protein
MSLIPNLDAMTDEEKLKILESIQKSIRESKEIQKKKVGENVQAVLTALRKIETDVIARFDSVSKTIETRVANIKDGRDGVAGVDGRPGRDGKDGRPGRDGKDGKDGAPGRDGVPGMDGVSVTNAFLDFDNSLVIELSNGQQINAGEVLPPDIAEKLKVVVNTSTGGVGLPEQTGNAGKYLTTDGTNLSWNDIAGGLDYQGTWNASTNTPTLASGVGTNGYYYIVSVAGTTNLDGVTDWQPGDWAIFNGTTWQKIDQSWATAGANDNITSMTGVTGGISSPDFIQFDTGATVTNAAGRLYWDATQQTLTVGLNANIAADVGQTLYAYATNDEAVTINKGQPVYMYSAQGDRVSVKLAYNTGDATSAKTLGVCAENIAAGQAGMILCQGVQDGLDLSAYTAGDTLYLGATAGTLTNVKPYAPNHLVYIGVVERANAGNGRLYVRVQNGYEMDELHNVSAQNPSNGQVLIYNASTSLWEKNTLTDGDGITITEGAGSITVTNAGVRTAQAGTGISVSGTNDITITNTGVTSLTGTTNEIDVSASTGSVTLSLPATINADTTGNAANVTGTVAIANGGTGQTTQTAAFDALAPTTTKGDLIVSNGSDNIRLAVGTNGYLLTADSAEASGIKWAAAPVSTTVANDTSTNASYYPVFSTATSGTFATATVSSTKLTYNPSLGQLSASVPRADNGIFVNKATVSTSYTIASGDNGMSAGTITVADGVTVTIADGSVWTVV